MNKVKIYVRPGDIIDDIIKTSSRIIKIKGVDFVTFTFNGIKLIYAKDSTPSSICNEYYRKLK